MDQKLIKADSQQPNLRFKDHSAKTQAISKNSKACPSKVSTILQHHSPIRAAQMTLKTHNLKEQYKEYVFNKFKEFKREVNKHLKKKKTQRD